jgi:hypothetical protein
MATYSAYNNVRVPNTILIYFHTENPLAIYWTGLRQDRLCLPGVDEGVILKCIQKTGCKVLTELMCLRIWIMERVS